MTMQSEHHQAGFMQSAAGQTIIVVAALVIVMAVAWFYVF